MPSIQGVNLMRRVNLTKRMNLMRREYQGEYQGEWKEEIALQSQYSSQILDSQGMQETMLGRSVD